jgi:transposase-like protein
MTIPREKREAILATVMGGASVRKACKEHAVTRSELYVDLAADADFADQYARALAIRADEQFDEMDEIVDTVKADPVEIAKAKLKVDTRKWTLARMNPRKYGDKVQVGGADDLPPVATVDATKLSSQALRA